MLRELLQCRPDVLEYEVYLKSASENTRGGWVVFISRIIPLVPVYVGEPHIWKLIAGIHKADVHASSFFLAPFISVSFLHR